MFIHVTTPRFKVEKSMKIDRLMQRMSGLSHHTLKKVSPHASPHLTCSTLRTSSCTKGKGVCEGVDFGEKCKRSESPPLTNFRNK